MEKRKVIDRFDQLGYTFTLSDSKYKNGADVTLDSTITIEGRPTTKIVHTSTDRATLVIKPSNPQKLLGKYVKTFLNIESTVKTIILYLWTGSASDGNIYHRTMSRASGHFVDGKQFMDIHLSQFSKTGMPDPNKPITQMKIEVFSEGATGSVGATVNIGLLESISRKPFILFVNDDGYREYTEDVIPMLESRKLPYTILWSQSTVLSYMNTPDVAPSGRVSLEQAKEIMKSPYAFGGLHVDTSLATAASLATFKENVRNQMNTATKHKLVKGALHVCALQNNYVDNDRWNFLRGFAATMRRGDGQSLVYGAELAGQTFIMPTAGSKINSIPVVEFNTSATAATVEKWIDDALLNETGIYVFGHGSTRLQPGYPYRSDIEVYQAFLRKYDSVKDKIDWISTDDFYERYVSSRNDAYTSLAALTYKF